MRNIFGWSLPPGCSYRDLDEAMGAFPPVTILSEQRHTAMRRQHMCNECFGAINIGDKYDKIVYKDEDTGRISQYKVHAMCPISDVECWR